jgi:hypothetical protein
LQQFIFLPKIDSQVSERDAKYPKQTKKKNRKLIFQHEMVLIKYILDFVERLAGLSVMISEPPINSPLTYNWGIVGQLAYSLMPCRIPSSASTLTVKGSLTPQAFYIWIARPEKPH